jgi:hypothetical protein
MAAAEAELARGQLRFERARAGQKTGRLTVNDRSGLVSARPSSADQRRRGIARNLHLRQQIPDHAEKFLTTKLPDRSGQTIVACLPEWQDYPLAGSLIAISGFPAPSAKPPFRLQLHKFIHFY